MLKEILEGVELFDGLSDDDLDQVAAICKERSIPRGDLLVKEGDAGEELFIITGGFVEVLLETPHRVVVNLGTGQITGEMALVDGGPRSASLRANASTKGFPLYPCNLPTTQSGIKQKQVTLIFMD